jgi:hypothetical protein
VTISYQTSSKGKDLTTKATRDDLPPTRLNGKTRMRKSSSPRAIGPRLMSQIIHARFEDGVLKPEDPLDLPPNARV